MTLILWLFNGFKLVLYCVLDYDLFHDRLVSMNVLDGEDWNTLSTVVKDTCGPACGDGVVDRILWTSDNGRREYLTM